MVRCALACVDAAGGVAEVGAGPAAAAVVVEVVEVVVEAEVALGFVVVVVVHSEEVLRYHHYLVGAGSPSLDCCWSYEMLS